MSELKRVQVAKALCAVTNPGVDPETPTHFGVPYEVWLPSWPRGFIVPPHEPRPLWQYFLPMADQAIAAIERAMPEARWLDRDALAARSFRTTVYFVEVCPLSMRPWHVRLRLWWEAIRGR